jgi:hypothetical protein
VPVETPDTTSFLRHAPRGCAQVFKKVVLCKAVLSKSVNLRVSGIANMRRPS